MADQLQLRGGTTSEHSTFTGALREVTVDTDKDTVVVHDGSTAGGRPLMREDQTNLPTSVTNGIAVPSANNVAISTNGTGRLFIDAAGRVGIFTANPGRGLVVDGVSDTIVAAFQSTATGCGFGLKDGTTTADNTVTLRAIGDNLVAHAGGTERLRITSDGKLGVGTSTPGSKLDIQDTSGTTNAPVIIQNISALSSGTVASGFGPAIRFQGEDAGGSNRDMAYVSSVFTNASTVDTALTFYTRDNLGTLTEKVRIDEQGDVGIGTTSPQKLLHLRSSTDISGSNVYDEVLRLDNTSSRGSDSGIGISFYQDTNERSRIAAEYDGSGQGLTFHTRQDGQSLSEKARIDSSGRLLVGTSSASGSAKLQVAGDITATGDLSGVDITATGTATISGLTYPTSDGSADQVLKTNGSGTLSFADRGRIVLETAQATTSGTSIDFTGIPSWVKKITVMFNGVSTSGASNLLVQIGAGSTTTTGYESVGTATGGSGWDANILTSTAGFLVKNGDGGSTNRVAGQMVLATMGANLWTACHNVASGATINRLALGSGLLTLSGTLDRVRITTVNGTDTFDAGSVNLLLEG